MPFEGGPSLRLGAFLDILGTGGSGCVQNRLPSFASVRALYSSIFSISPQNTKLCERISKLATWQIRAFFKDDEIDHGRDRFCAS
jgi:hypothetical protein